MNYFAKSVIVRIFPERISLRTLFRIMVIAPEELEELENLANVSRMILMWKGKFRL